MKIWSRFPVFRLLIPFSSGIFLASKSFMEFNSMIFLLVVSVLICYAFTIRNYATGKYAQRWLTGIPFTICFFMAGYVFTIIRSEQGSSYHFTKFDNVQVYMLEAEGTVKLSSKGIKVFTKVKAALDTTWKSCRGNLLLYIRDSVRNEFLIRTGDMLFVRCRTVKIPGPMNPGEFDYREYLFQKGITDQAFVSIDDIEVHKSGTISLYRVASELRESMLKKLRIFIPGKEEAGVAGALLLGYEEWLDPELENNYTGAGVLHVLCVSGMHVGLIYLILSWPMGWMEKKRLTRHLRNVILIFMIWFYALLTGLSPSVIRASAMITFVITGKWLNKESEIANILCGSCLCMFLFDPFLLKSAGFQLSFLAVCGIVFLHPLIVAIPGISSRFIFKIWELI
jgi:competence protein ComEC